MVVALLKPSLPGFRDCHVPILKKVNHHCWVICPESLLCAAFFLWIAFQDRMTLYQDRFALHLYDEISRKYCQIRLLCSLSCVKCYDAQKQIEGENKISCSWYLHRFHITPKQLIQSLECIRFIQYSARLQHTVWLKLLYVRQQASKRLLKAPVQDKMWRVHNV